MSSLKDFFRPEFDSSKPYRGFTELPHGKYRIVRFKLVKNKFAKGDKGSEDSPRSSTAVMVELEDQVLFLPQHLARRFQENPGSMREINTSDITFYLYFGGMRDE